MALKEYLKRGLHFIVKGVPVRKITPTIVTLAPNELLKGRYALITGGTSGIGFCIAKAFLDSGATVIITSRNDERLKISCEKLAESYKERIFGIVLDNTKVNTFEQAFQNAISLIGGRHIDILVNNAGILGGDIRTTSVTEYDNVMNTNLRGVFFLSQLFGKYMKENGIEGNILNIASSSSLRPAVSAYI